MFVKRFFILSALLLLSAALLNRAVDPFQLYHYDPDARLWSPASDGLAERLQVAGLIRSFPFDEILMGSSMVQNTSLGALKDHFHRRPIRLAMRGSTIAAQSLALESALAKGKVKHVIWGLDQEFFHYDETNRFEHTPVEAFKNSPKLFLSYLLNLRVLAYSLLTLKDRILKKAPLVTLENFGHWDHSFEFSKEIVLSVYENRLKSVKKIDGPCDISLPFQNFQNDVLRLARLYPDVEFSLFFPPYSLAYYKMLYVTDVAGYLAHGEFRRKMMESLVSLPNVKLHDFEIDKKTICNLDNYCDLNHYSREINDRIISLIKTCEFLITEENIEEHCALYERLGELNLNQELQPCL